MFLFILINMENKSFLSQLIRGSSLFKIVDFLLENKGMDYSKTDIANGAGISRATLFNYWKELEEYNVIKVTRQFGKTKLFTLNSKSLIVRKILDLEKALISEAMDKEIKKKKGRIKVCT